MSLDPAIVLTQDEVDEIMSDVLASCLRNPCATQPCRCRTRLVPPVGLRRWLLSDGVILAQLIDGAIMDGPSECEWFGDREILEESESGTVPAIAQCAADGHRPISEAILTGSSYQCPRCGEIVL